MFLMPAMLLGLGAVAIPVVIHLLHRQRTTPIRWGAMQFLVESELQSKRRRLVEHWLLLLARMAVLGLLALALARPLLNADLATPLGGGTSTDFAVVLDHSLSMGRASAGGKGDGKTAFARGVDLADQIAASLRPADSFAVVLAEHSPRPLVDRPVSGVETSKLRESLQQLPPGSTDANLADAVQAAREVLRRGRGAHKKIIVVSDEQRGGWQIDNAAAWKAALADATGGVDPTVQVFDLAVPIDARAANVSVGTPTIQPGVVGPGDRVEITAAVSRSESGELAGSAVPVRLTVDGQPVSSQTLTDLAPGSTRTVRFEHAFATAGSHWLKVDADVRDGLAADNAATLALHVPEKLPVLIVDGQLTAAGSFRASQFLAAAMQPSDGGGLLRPTIVSASDAGGQRLSDYAAVVVNDVPAVPPDALAKLADYARGGHGVWFILGPRTRPSFVNGDLARSGLASLELAADKPAQAEGGSTGVAVGDATNRAVAVLTAGGDKNPLAGVVATQWWPVKPGADARTVIATTRGEPLVLDRAVGTEGGRVIVWTTGADGHWNTLPLAAAFVPLVNETVQHLAGPTVQATWGRALQPGQPIVWTAPLSPPVMAATVTAPSGGQAEPVKVVTEAGRAVARFDGTFAPGVYEMRFTPSAVPQPVYFSVAPDPRELDPATLTTADVRWLKNNRFLQARVEPSQIAALTATAGSGSELWPTLAFAVVGMLVVETFMTRRMVRLQVGTARVA